MDSGLTILNNSMRQTIHCPVISSHLTPQKKITNQVKLAKANTRVFIGKKHSYLTKLNVRKQSRVSTEWEPGNGPKVSVPVLSKVLWGYSALLLSALLPPALLKGPAFLAEHAQGRAWLFQLSSAISLIKLL